MPTRADRPSASGCPARKSRQNPARRSAAAASLRSRASMRPPPMSPDRQDDFRRLAWTTAGLVAALGPHLVRLQPWVSAFVLAVAGWRLVAERRGWRMPVGLVRG